MQKLRFGSKNAKLDQLAAATGRKVYTFSLLSGHTCPYAKICHSRAMVRSDGTRYVQDGKHTQFRCFSASQEAFYTNVYKHRNDNTEAILACGNDRQKIASLILDSLPKGTGYIIRIHVGGDFKTQNYFDAWLDVARQRPDITFYAYTKSLPFWVKRRDNIPDNVILTASRGGMKDELIDRHGLREAVVVYSEAEAEKLGYAIDHDDTHAALTEYSEQSFALLIHGLQPAKSKARAAVKALNGKGSYGPKSKEKNHAAIQTS